MKSKNREFLKADKWDEWETLQLDQREGVRHPLIQKPYPEGSELIELVHPENFTIGEKSVIETINSRQSHRSYTGDPISLEELSYLLWATQGIHRIILDGQTVIRTVPSAGARHPFETYIFINSVERLEIGLYRYLGVEHKLLPLESRKSLVHDVHSSTNEQYVIDCAVVFIWSTIPYRAEWRYGPLAHKMIAQDSGHVCQNLYLACGSIGIGTCAIGAYNQKKMDEVINVDGENEFTIYVATVGRIG
jgi:SagB-type dehydrogenase family enzyme